MKYKMPVEAGYPIKQNTCIKSQNSREISETPNQHAYAFKYIKYINIERREKSNQDRGTRKYEGGLIGREELIRAKERIRKAEREE